MHRGCSAIERIRPPSLSNPTLSPRGRGRGKGSSSTSSSSITSTVSLTCICTSLLVLLYDQHHCIQGLQQLTPVRSGNPDAHFVKVGKREKKRHLELDLGLAYSEIRSADRLSTTTPPSTSISPSPVSPQYNLSTNTTTQDPEVGSRKSETMQPLQKPHFPFPSSLTRSQTAPYPPQPAASGSGSGSRSRNGDTVLNVRNTGRGVSGDNEDVIREYEEKRDR